MPFALNCSPSAITNTLTTPAPSWEIPQPLCPEQCCWPRHSLQSDTSHGKTSSGSRSFSSSPSVSSAIARPHSFISQYFSCSRQDISATSPQAETTSPTSSTSPSPWPSSIDLWTIPPTPPFPPRSFSVSLSRRASSMLSSSSL